VSPTTKIERPVEFDVTLTAEGERTVGMPASCSAP